MADVTNKTWKIKLYHNSPDDVVIPATFKYDGKNPVSVNLSKTPQEVETLWATKPGVSLDEKLITVEYEPVVMEEQNKKYTISSVNWELHPKKNDIVYKVVVEPSVVDDNKTSGSTEYGAFYVTENNGIEVERLNVTDLAEWSLSDDRYATLYGNGGVDYKNETADNLNITVSATYNKVVGNAALKVKGLPEYGLLYVNGKPSGSTFKIEGDSTTYTTTGSKQYIGKYLKSTVIKWSASNGEGYNTKSGTKTINGNVTQDKESIITFTLAEKTYAISVEPTGTATDPYNAGHSAGTMEYHAYLLTDGVKGDDITTQCDWSVDKTNVATASTTTKGSVNYKNDSTSNTTVKVTATHNKYGSDSQYFSIYGKPQPSETTIPGYADLTQNSE